MVTQCWFFEEQGRIGIYAGGYTDALQQQQQAKPVSAQVTSSKSNESAKSDTNKTNSSDLTPEQATKKKVKLSYNEQRELAQLPNKIEELETAIADLQAQIGHSDFFNQPHEVTSPILQSLADKEAELEVVFERWEQLEALTQ